MIPVLVTGAGGFIGHRLVTSLVERGFRVRGADLRFPAHEPTAAHEFLQCDLRLHDACQRAVQGTEQVYHLAADTGDGAPGQQAEAALNTMLIGAHMAKAAIDNRVRRFLYASSARVYPTHLRADAAPLGEDRAWPARPERGSGLAELAMEELCRAMGADWNLQTRIARIHEVYGPHGPDDDADGPAAICRKVALCPDGGAVAVRGEGRRMRAFLYVDDCVEGLQRLMQSDHAAQLNLGSDAAISTDDLVETVADLAGKRIATRHDGPEPVGARGRASDNTRIRRVLGWEPATPLRTGLAQTYRWIAAEHAARRPAEGAVLGPGRVPHAAE